MNTKDNNKKDISLTLYVAGNEPNSVKAMQVVEELCEKFFNNPVTPEIIDVYDNYREALNNKIMVVPTLIVHTPELNTKIVGSLKSAKKLAIDLGLTGNERENGNT